MVRLWRLALNGEVIRPEPLDRGVFIRRRRQRTILFWTTAVADRHAVMSAEAARVAIVGRPNVGKSTLFNRLVGRRAALVHDTPGVTRDRKEAPARLQDLHFSVVDTAGLEEAASGAIEGRMAAQALRALEDAAVALFLIDARAGVTPDDRHFANLLRRAGTPVVLLANKCEGREAARS